MPDVVGSLNRHAAAAACLLTGLFIAGAPAAAQSLAPAPLEAPGTSLEFLSRYDFRITGTALFIDDERFTWDAHFGGTFDVVDYGYGRASIVADYEVVMGNEYRPFDANQGYYDLEGSLSIWIGRTVEAAAFFHHVSRHTSDRPKPYAIAWNSVGGRVLRRLTLRGTTLAFRVDLGGVIQSSDVDYTWITKFDVIVRRPLKPRLGVFARGTGEIDGVDPAVRQRAHPQRGGRIEGGVRIEGRSGALELLVGWEQRLDADPVDYLPLRWPMVGVRVLSR
jgi:hypothetical protein